MAEKLYAVVEIAKIPMRRIRRTESMKRNKIIVIIDAKEDEDYKAIEKELLDCARKLRRKRKELSYIICPREETESVMTEKSYEFRFKVPEPHRCTIQFVECTTVR